MKTLLIVSHPNLEASTANKALVEGVKDIENLTVRHLESIYGSDIKAFDVELEQKLLLEHDRVIFQFPWYWYSSPAMLKAYQDEVFTYGFAYGSAGDKLNGKIFKIAVTVGAPDYAYQEGGWNKKSMNELLSPFQSMTNLTGMTYTRAFRVHGTAAMNNEQLEQKVQEYRDELLDKSWNNGLNKYARTMNEDSVKAK